MKCIASYYIKTLFLWKIYEEKLKNEGRGVCDYWQKGLSVTFRCMVTELHNAIQKKSIPYFWNEELNLIANVKQTVLDSYANDLGKVLASIDCNNVNTVLSYLLNSDEMHEFKKYQFDEQHPRKTHQVYTASVISASETSTFPMERQGSAGSLKNASETPTFPMSRQGSAGSLKSASETPKQISRHGSNGSLTSALEYSKVQDPMKEVVDLLKSINMSIGSLRKDTPMESNKENNSDGSAAGTLKSVKANMHQVNRNIENLNERMNKLELGVGVKKEKTTYNLDHVVALGQRLQNLEWIINHKGKYVVEVDEDARAEIETRHSIPECASSEAKQGMNENDAVLEKLDEYNKRIKKLEQEKVGNTSKCSDMKAWYEEFDSMVEQLERNKKPINESFSNKPTI